MSRSEIVAEIVRTAVANGGAPLGHRAFERETGIRHADWFGIYWRSWGAAVQEAGLTANTLTGKIDEAQLLRAYCLLARELNRYPTVGDFRLKKRSDPTFPNDTVFSRRYGSFPGARAKAYAFSLVHSEFSDVSALLAGASAPMQEAARASSPVGGLGYVYMIKHGSRSEYKIGKTANPLRREGEIRLQLPEALASVHYIATDDPSGVEAYWHARFASKRKEGEWFALSRDDVAAFKRWKRIS
jgi:hypothetical protein